MDLKRGDIVTAALPGDFGKPRPALVIQRVEGVPATVTLALITSDLNRVPALRVSVQPTARNGLLKPSEVIADNIQTALASKIGRVIGSLEPETMRWVEVALKLHLGLA